MKLITILILFLSFCTPCAAHGVEYYKGLLVLVSVMDDGPEPVKCLCGGTGLSGDGLGPCGCPDGCTGCEPKRAKHENIDDLLKESKPISIQQDQIAKNSPKLQLLYFSTTNCKPCQQVETEFQAMRGTGWKIGTKDHDHVIKSSDYRRFNVTSFPCFILLSGGVEVKRHYGYMDRWKIAEFRKVQPVSTQPVYKGVSVPGLRTPFEQSVKAILDMLGAEFSPNRFVKITSPERVEISIEKTGNSVLVRFHGNKPGVSVGGVFQPDITHLTLEGNRLTAHWNGMLSILKDKMEVEFE